MQQADPDGEPRLVVLPLGRERRRQQRGEEQRGGGPGADGLRPQ